MKRTFLFFALFAFLSLGCKIPENTKEAAVLLRIESAPDIIEISPGGAGDVQVQVIIENYTDTSMFDSELSTAYLEYYEVAVLINGEKFSTKRVPSRVIIKQGASVKISTLIFTEEEKRNILRQYGIPNNLLGYAEVKYLFSDIFGNRVELTYKPIIRISE